MKTSGMKKALMLGLAAICGAANLQAQDMILKRDSSRIEARITEISTAEVRYKRHSNPEGPTYVLPLADIRAIRYANGDEELFEAPAPAPTPAPAPADATPAVSAPRLRPYAVGDYYEEGGVQGIVCYVDASGEHGLILSRDEASLAWSLFRKSEQHRTGAVHPSDGQQNMETVARYITENALSWSDFPAFEWCRSHGEGWYLPSIDEMLAIGHAYHGGSRAHSDRRARNRFNEALRMHGGKRMDRMLYYFSSTEKDDKEALTSHMEIDPPYLVEIPKHNRFLVRAVHRF